MVSMAAGAILSVVGLSPHGSTAQGFVARFLRLPALLVVVKGSPVIGNPLGEIAVQVVNTLWTMTMPMRA